MEMGRGRPMEAGAEKHAATKTPSTKNIKSPMKGHHRKKKKTKTQEKFARTIPYRFSWEDDPDGDTSKPWETKKMHSSQREQLPLRKGLVPMRSIPVRGLGSPNSVPLSSLCPPPPPPPMSYFWELQLLSQRFPDTGSQLPGTSVALNRKPF